MAESRSTLGKALSRLFSSNMVVRNLGDKELKIVDPSNVQSVASKYYDTRYKGLRSQSGGGRMGRSGRQGQQAPGSNIGYLSSRTGLYRDYETMDTDAIISAALDMYADEAVAENEYGDILTINAEDQEVKDIIHNLFYDVLDIEFNLRWWVRTLAKYGDCYLKLDISEEYGILSAQPMSPFEVERIEGVEDDPYGVKFKHEGMSDQPEYEFWEVAHFRLLSDGNYLPYGKSVLEGARRTWKQLCLHEESRIWTEHGYEKIKNIESGDVVYSFDPEEGELVKTEVNECQQMADQDTYTVSTRHREIRATDRHGLLVYSENEEYSYKAVEDIEVGSDSLVLPESKESENYDHQKVTNIELYEENSKTYDLEVENDLHNFVADGVVSHNTLLEDAMLVHRVMRAPEKRIFRIDVGNIEPDAVDTFMDQIIQEIQKTPLIDPDTGEYNLKYNMMNMIEDYYLPVRGGESGTEIDTLSGLEYQAIEDVEYLRKKMMTALRIPNAFLGYEEELEGKCLHPDTEIELLSGEKMRVEDIAEAYNEYNDEDLSFWTYSYDFENDCVVPGEIVEAEKTREDAEIVEVVLDNGETVKTTPDHDFILQDGTEVEAQNLEEGDSLRTIEKREKELGQNACEYEQVFQPEDEEWDWTHKMVDRYFNGKIEENGYDEEGRFSHNKLTVVHHEDFDRYNNRPDNLRRMNFVEHRELHQNYMKKSLLSEESKRKSKETKQTEEYSKKISNIVKNYLEENPEAKYRVRDVWLSLSPEERSEIVSKGWEGDEERKKEQAQRAKENGRHEQMLQARKENDFENTLEGKDHPKYRERPTFDEIVEFIENWDEDPERISTIWKLEDEFGLTKYILQEVIEENGYNCTQFMNEFWGFKRGRKKELHPETFENLSASCEDMDEFVNRIDAYSKRTAKSIVENNGYEFEDWKENILGSCYNHKVAEVRFLDETVDTYNIEVKDKNDNHNFLTSSGLVLKNSTLSQQSIKFANQVKYMQKIIVSEMKKMAIIHLFSLGIRDERLVNFELSLTNPSTVRESEYLDLLSEKVDLARTIDELPIFSTTWIYKNLFDLSDEEIRKQRELKKDDKKRQFQYQQIETEGNDPVKTGQSFGTPHDLAMSGSADVKPLSLEKKDKEDKKKDAVKDMQKSKQNTFNDPLGKEKAFDSSNLRDEEPDYEQRYRDREGLPVDHITPQKKKELLQESLGELENKGKFAAKLRDDEESEDIIEGTYMDEEVIDKDI